MQGNTSKKRTFSLAIGGDFVPCGQGVELFNTGAAEKLVGEELLTDIHACAFGVFNLEVPLVDHETPIDKCGPNLSAPTSSVKGLGLVNPWLFSLANNHIMDHGSQGLSSTMGTLRQAGISFFGAGNNLQEAKEPYIFKNECMSVGIFSCAEHEFSIATDYSAGANPYDPLVSFDDVESLKDKCDYVVVLYHGGKEHYRYPSPELQRVCRKFIEKGANLVVCQHSHCIGCREEYGCGTIIYGQGNFLFDDVNDEYWNSGLLIRVHFDVYEESVEQHVEYIPIVKDGVGVRKAEGKQRDLLLRGFEERSREILSPDFVRSEYDRYAEQMLDIYSSTFCPGSRSILFRILNKLSKHRLIWSLITKAQLLAEINYLECEAHRELYVQGLKRRLTNLGK